MKRNILNSLLILALMAMVTACKTKKVVVKNPSAVTGVPASDKKMENLKLLRSKDIAYTTLSLKGKANLNIGGNENNVNITIRIKKDEKIWMSITAIAGIEVARVLLTPDSLLLLNRLQATAVKKSFSYVNNFSNKQVNFKMLQSVLSGNTIDDFMNEQSVLDLNSNEFMLSGAAGDLAYKTLFNTLLKSSETNLNDVKAGKALKIIYTDYQQLTDALFPSVIKISSMSGMKKINIALDFSKIERNVQLDFPFTVPKRFEIIN